MEILPGVLCTELFIYLVKYKTLIISDVHLGYDETLHERGILIPKNNISDLKNRVLKSKFELSKRGFAIKSIVLNGDLFHKFGKISAKEKHVLKDLMLFFRTFGDVKFIEGNHDKILTFLTDADVYDSLCFGDILVTHGDVVVDQAKTSSVKTIVIGHEHPAITLTTGIRSEKFKCFLKGKFKGKQLVVMPSCNSLVEGSNVLKDGLLSPYITKIQDFEVFIIEDKIYDFGKLKRLGGSLK